MASPTVTYQFVNSTTSDATQVNQNFSDLLNAMTDGTKTFTLAAIVASISTLGEATVTSINNFTLPSVPASTLALQSNSSGDISASNQFVGSVAGTDPAAGIFGEVLRSVQSSLTSVASTGVFQDMLTLSLTKGNWLLYGQSAIQQNGATITSVQNAISTNSGNTTTDHVFADNVMPGVIPTSGNDGPASVIGYRINTGSDITAYYKINVGFTVANPNFRARFIAVRLPN